MVAKKKYRRLSTLSRAEIVNRLAARNYTPAVVSEMVSRIMSRRDDKKRAARDARKINNAWEPTIENLVSEINYICVRLIGLRKSTHPHKALYIDVYSEYDVILKQTRALLRTHQRAANKPPALLILEKIGQKPHNLNLRRTWGESWVDWVSPHIKASLLSRQQGLAYRTRPLEPFFRREEYFMRQEQQKNLRIRAQWIEERNGLLDVIARKPAGTRPFEEKNVQLITLALQRLDEQGLLAKSPTGWRNMITQADYERLSPHAIDLGLTNILPASVLDDYDYVDDEGNPIT
jgi:hypothetical protein